MAVSVFTVTMTSNQTEPTTGVDLGLDGWDHMTMLIPSSPSGSGGLLVSDELEGTYYLHSTSVNSAVIANGAAVTFTGGVRFVKPYNTSGVSVVDSVFKIICGRS